MLFAPVVAQTGGSFATVAINLAYPLADLLLVGFLVLGLAADGWRASRSQLLVASALAVLLVADTVFLFEVSAGTFVENTLLDTGLVRRDGSVRARRLADGRPVASRSVPRARLSRSRRRRRSRCSPSAC